MIHFSLEGTTLSNHKIVGQLIPPLSAKLCYNRHSSSTIGTSWSCSSRFGSTLNLNSFNTSTWDGHFSIPSVNTGSASYFPALYPPLSALFQLEWHTSFSLVYLNSHWHLLIPNRLYTFPSVLLNPQGPTSHTIGTYRSGLLLLHDIPQSIHSLFNALPMGLVIFISCQQFSVWTAAPICHPVHLRHLFWTPQVA